MERIQTKTIRKSLEKREILVNEDKLDGEKVWKLSKYSTEPRKREMNMDDF